MCGEKQSLKHVYGTGSGKECRLIVQKLSEKTMQSDFKTAQIVEGILDGSIKIKEDLNENIETESDIYCVMNESGSIWSGLLDNFTEKEEIIEENLTSNLPPISTVSSSNNIYRKPERKSTSSSYSKKYNPYGPKSLPKLVGYQNKEISGGLQSASKDVSNSFFQFKKESHETVDLKKEEEKLPEIATNNDYWGTDNLNDEELDEILKI